MILNISQKQIGKQNKKIVSVPMEFEKQPGNMKELLAFTVENMVNAFNERVKRGTEDATLHSLSEEQMEAMADIGRISFGVIYQSREQDVDQAIETAIMAYADGIVRVFINGELVDVPTDNGSLRPEDLEAYRLDLKEGDEIAFIRLAMLAGRMW